VNAVNVEAGDTLHGAPEREQGDEMQSLRDALVMMVDDEPLNIEVTQVHLEEAGYTRFVSTDDPLQALELIAARRPDVLLLDLMMPGMSGFEILERMAATNVLQDVPTIVLTSSTDPRTKLKALELGATDFLAKPVDSSELVLRLRNTLAAKAYRDRLANYDLLTALPNRHTFMGKLGWALSHAVRYGHKGAVLHVGLDDFKKINEALGPSLGDAMLQQIARRLEQCVRLTDTVGRLDIHRQQPTLSRISGDEFTILLPEVRAGEDAGLAAERVLAQIAEPIHLLEHEVRVTCSIGITVIPDDADEADTVLRNAGTAMHYAKACGKNAARFYSSELNARALQKFSLETQLRRALEREELMLYYQPKVHIASGRIVGAEALVRWQHPERGLVMPGDFVLLAEETGLITPLGEYVLRAACRQSAQWRAAGYEVPRISVNVSSHQFRQSAIVAVMESALRDAGSRVEDLTLELTEGTLMENTDQNVQTLQRLKAIGAKLSMDDFGTGYSSLSYLSRLPLDEIKIDRSFVMQVVNPGDRCAIITAIIAMAHSLELSVVAEGIETEAQLAFLAANGCDEYQGYLKSKPIPADDFASRFLAVDNVA
jgi:diguanylate cyclase (GGDEF)-like protein